MASFAKLGEIDNSKRCLTEARDRILRLWPLTEKNEWANGAPPAEIVEALELLSAAKGHLTNLCTYGSSGYTLTHELEHEVSA